MNTPFQYMVANTILSLTAPEYLGLFGPLGVSVKYASFLYPYLSQKALQTK